MRSGRGSAPACCQDLSSSTIALFAYRDSARQAQPKGPPPPFVSGDPTAFRRRDRGCPISCFRWGLDSEPYQPASFRRTQRTNHAKTLRAPIPAGCDCAVGFECRYRPVGPGAQGDESGRDPASWMPITRPGGCVEVNRLARHDHRPRRKSSLRDGHCYRRAGAGADPWSAPVGNSRGRRATPASSTKRTSANLAPHKG